MKTKKRKKELPLIPLSRPLVEERTYKAVEGVLRSGWWTIGPKTRELEKRFAEYVGVEHAVALSSCSSALDLALGRLIRVMDEYQYEWDRKKLVAVSPMTFVSTVNAIWLNGMIPHFVDIDRRTGCMDPFLLEEAVRRNGAIKTVLITHFAGHPCDMDAIMRVVNDRDLFLVEDCAHAVETLWRGRHAGTFGRFGCFSFNPTKNIAAPEMGMVVGGSLDDERAFQGARLHGMNVSLEDRVRKPGSYDITLLARKNNPTDVEAVVALHQLEAIEKNWAVRRTLWERYAGEMWQWARKSLDIGGPVPDCRHGLHLFQFPVNGKTEFIRRMRERYGVYCGNHYTPVHEFSYMVDGRRQSLPEAEWWGRHMVSIPFGPGLREDEVVHVIAAVKALYRLKEHRMERGV